MAKATEELVGVQMALLYCAACGLPFMMPTEYEQRRRNDHQSFFCPSGHPNVYNAKSEAERLKEQLANARESVQWERSRADRAAEEAEHARRSRNGMKGQLAKLKKQRGTASTRRSPLPG